MLWVWAVLWYLSGVAGCTLGLYADLKNGQDLTVSDLLKTLFCSVFGPLMFISGLVYFLNRIEFTDRVLIKGLRK